MSLAQPAARCRAGARRAARRPALFPSKHQEAQQVVVPLHVLVRGHDLRMFLMVPTETAWEVPKACPTQVLRHAGSLVVPR